MARPAGPRPPVALYIHIPFCVSLCPYCDFVVITGAAARGRATGSASSSTRSWSRSTCARTRSTRVRGGRARRRLESVYLGGGTPSLLPPDEIERIVGASATRFGIAADAEITLEANPGPDERGDPAALAAPASRGCRSEPSRSTTRSCASSAAGIAPRHVADAVAAAREAGHPGRSTWTCCTTSPNRTWRRGWRPWTRALAMEPDHLSLYALTLDDPGRRGPDRADRRPPADDHGGAPLARSARGRPGRGPGGGPVPPRDGGDWRKPATAATRSRNWARPGHESRHNLAYWQRRPHEARRARRARVRRRRPGAGTRRGSTRYVAALGAATPALPPGGEEVIDAATAAAEAVILGLRLDTGVPLATAQEPPLADAFGWALAAELLTVTAGRPGRADDPRPAPLERAVRALV